MRFFLMAKEDRIKQSLPGRRSVLQTLGTGALGGLAGCAGFLSEDEQNDGHSHSHGAPNATADYVEGGKITVGMTKGPSTLNLLKAHTVQDFDTIGAVYDLGTVNHPETGKPVPWMIEEMEAKPDNIGTSKPTVTITLEEDLKWNDGKDVTAEDIVFTVKYLEEQQPRGTLSAKEFKSVEDVTYDKASGRKVHFFFTQPDNAWSTQVVGNAFIPKHQWKNISNYWEFEPEKPEEIIGSGPLRMTDFEWGNYFEFEMRDDDVIPWPQTERIDWLHEEAPFIDGVRMEIFDSQSDVVEALKNGDIHLSNESVNHDFAKQSRDIDHLELKKAHAHGWSHQTFNTRRVPLDDPAFRQLLVLLFDWDFVVEEAYDGVGASRGSYATPKEYTEWRPPEPTEIDEYEGVPIPDFTFPGEVGTFEIDEDGIETARNFLQNNERAKHDYTFGKAVTDASAAEDGKELYVNGEPLSKAHTDNDGTPGQGPLEMSYTTEDPKRTAVVERWMDVLMKFGIPVSPSTTTFKKQVDEVFVREEFDMFEASWENITVSNTHYWEFFASPGADMDSTSDAVNFNAAGYTAVEDLVNKQRQMMKYEPRKPVVKKILANVWNDAPTLVTHHEKMLQPVNDSFIGWVRSHGGVNGRNSWLNVRKRADSE